MLADGETQNGSGRGEGKSELDHIVADLNFLHALELQPLLGHQHGCSNQIHLEPIQSKKGKKQTRVGTGRTFAAIDVEEEGSAGDDGHQCDGDAHLRDFVILQLLQHTLHRSLARSRGKQRSRSGMEDGKAKVPWRGRK